MSCVVNGATPGMWTASPIHHRRNTANCVVLGRLNGYYVIAAHILIHTEPGKAAIVAATLRDLPDVSEAAILAGPYDVIARAQARSIDELAKLVTSRIQALDGVRRTMTCPVVHL